MYLGNTGVTGLHHMVWEILDNAMDEVLAGHAKQIEVTLEKDGSCRVLDDGRGIPCDVHSATGRSALETVLCVLHAGGKFGGTTSGYKVSGGLHGVGLSVVNALSESVEVVVFREKQRHTLSCARGRPLGPLRSEEETSLTNQTGTLVRFKPDFSIFDATKKIDASVVAERMDELAYLHAGLTLRLRDERTGTTRDFLHRGGIAEFADSLMASKKPLHAALGPGGQKKNNNNATFSSSSSTNAAGVSVECALRWCATSYSETIVSFANGIRTTAGGSHVDGLKSTITRTVNAALKKAAADAASSSKKRKDTFESLPGEFIREGLVAVLSVQVPEPEFEGQTKAKLGGSSGVRQAVDAVVGDALHRLFEFEPRALSAIGAKAMAAQAAASAAKAARELARKKSQSNLLGSAVLPGKLTDCSSKSLEHTELFIVEGDSAAGSAKQGRDRRTQAILPLRGKILNVEKSSLDKIYKNTELQALMAALGLQAATDAQVDLASLRYGRVIIMTDADVDGAHIRALILTFFYRFFTDLIEQGHVFIACPPLYKVSPKNAKTARQDLYCWTDDQLGGIDTSSKDVQRFKGLGEMMPEQLWATTMDPTKRKLQKVHIEDAKLASDVVNLLMGERVADRKGFIAEQSRSISDKDIDV